MAKMIFVNLPVEDLTKAVAFYEAIGATRNAQFSDDTGACMVFSDTIYVMLLSHAKFAGFSPRPIADAHATSQVLLAISCDSRADVDRLNAAALAAGGGGQDRRRITASCTGAASPIPTATSGSPIG